MSDAEDELTADDDWPAQFSQVPAWITMHPRLKSSAVRMWAFLALFVSPGKKVAYPGTALIASVLGLSRKDKVAPYTRQLVEAGAIRVEEQKTPSGRRYRYFLRFAPPVGYDGPVSTSDLKMLHPDGRGGGPEKGSTPKTGHSSGGGPEKGSMGGPEKGATHGPQKGARTTTSGTTTKGTTGCGCGSTSTTDACACTRDDADASATTSSRKRSYDDLAEAELLEARAKAARAEREKAQRQQQPVYPPAEYVNGRWRPAGAVNDQESKRPANGREKPAQTRRSRRHELPDDFRVSDAMLRWAASTVPTVDPHHETAQFISHHRANGTLKASWPDEWQKWMRNAAKFASERAARGQKTVPRMPDGTPMTYADGSPLRGADLKFAQNMQVVAALKAQEEAQVDPGGAWQSGNGRRALPPTN